jgi:hypothetical protein
MKRSVKTRAGFWPISEILRVLSKRLFALNHGSACGKGGRLEQLRQLRIAAKKMRLHARIVHFPESRCHPRMARSAQEDATVLGSINDLEIVHDILLNSRGASNLNRFDDAHLRVGRDDPC